MAQWEEDSMSVAKKAVSLVLKYEITRGWNPKDVSGNRTFIGYDIVSLGPGGETRLIEVKGTRNKHGIPDMTETEFTRNLTLIATHLYIVGNINSEPLLYIIPRKELKPEYLTMKVSYHVKSGFQKLLPEKYFVEKLKQ
jgi:hypothetical protein